MKHLAILILLLVCCVASYAQYVPPAGSGGGGGGSGTVTTTGTTTVDAIVTSNGTTVVKTPSATTTLDSSGNIATPGSVTAASFSTSGTNAGFAQFKQGPNVWPGTANAAGWGAPTSIAVNYELLLPAAAPSNSTPIMSCATPSANLSTCTWVAALPAQYKIWTCETGLGDGLNAVTAGTYLQSFCWNKTGVTVTLTGLQCYTDNAGSSTMAATNSAATALLTGAVTCSSTIASGTQSATTTIAANDFIEFTFVADGTSKQTTWVIAGTY